MWAPGNPLARADGVTEDVEQFRTYLRGVLGADYDPARVDAFLAAAPEMVRFFHEHTALTFVPGATICDVYGHLPGAGAGHRSAGPAPSTAAALGAEVTTRLRRQLYETSFLGMGVMAGPDLAAFLSASRGDLHGLLHATRRVGRHAYDLVTHRRGMQLVNGTALVGRLLRSAMDLGVEVRVDSPATELLRGDDAPHRCRRDDTGRAAAGDRHPRRRPRGRRFPAGRHPAPGAVPAIPTGAEHWSLAPTTADGAGTTLGESVGWAPAHRPGRTRRVVPGVAGALPLGPHRVLPAHHGPSQTGKHRRARAPGAASSTRPTATTTTSRR